MAEVTVPGEEGNLHDLMKALAELHIHAGDPSLREIANDQKFSYGAVNHLYRKITTRVPSYPHLEGVVRFLATRARNIDNVDQMLDDFHILWIKARTDPQVQLPLPASKKPEDATAEITTHLTNPQVQPPPPAKKMSEDVTDKLSTQSTSSSTSTPDADYQTFFNFFNNVEEKGALTTLRTGLHELREIAGKPSYMRLERKTRHSRVAILDLFDRNSILVPDQDLVRDVSKWLAERVAGPRTLFVHQVESVFDRLHGIASDRRPIDR